MALRLTTILIFAFFVSNAKESDSLDIYLKKCSTVFNIDGTFPDSVITNKMAGKQLFVMGESHDGVYNNSVRLKIIETLNQKQHLSKYLIELGRSVGYLNNSYLNGTYTLQIPIYYHNSKELGTWWKNELELLKVIKEKYALPGTFTYEGIDFERGFNFYVAMRNLFNNKNYSNNENLLSLSKALADSVYINYDMKDFSRFYDEVRAAFYKDSNALQQALNKTDFETLKYLLSNPVNTLNVRERNNYIAQNILTAINLNDDNFYFLNIGLGHTDKSDKGGAVSILENEINLANKILVMNVYDEIADSGNRFMKFMNNKAILNCFKEAAKEKGRFVLFDLSALPPKYAEIKRNCDLILFVSK